MSLNYLFKFVCFIEAAKYWFNPTTGTADYFNSCSTDFDIPQNTLLFSVPQNYIGYQNARTGNAYGGYYCGLKPDTNFSYYEYLSVKLINTLQTNKKYKLIYYLSLADSIYRYNQANPYVNNSGVHFSANQININNFFKIPVSAQINSKSNIFLKDKIGWQKIEEIYTALGNENYLTIGTFLKHSQIESNYYNPSDSAISVYYYVDDVSLTEYNDIILPTIIPEIFTPNNDNYNDGFKIDYLEFQDKDFLVQIFNRWGNQVYQSTQPNFEWNGTYKNQSLPSSTYYVLITATKKDNTPFMYKGFLQLTR
ncbi:MAG: gliding motility-associated C-terminal domain-containing protein [Bacteroidetes bacterium]|nr:gliding motility-associated C-terminal domain-containing protein [Bacteroidota bacterium]